MPLYNFKAQFADAVRSGAKRQTIRARGKRPPPKPGEIAHLYQGLRTKHVTLLGKHAITAVTAITISPHDKTVRVPREVLGTPCWTDLTSDEVEELARADGFPSAEAFFEFFAGEPSGSLSGYLIKW